MVTYISKPDTDLTPQERSAIRALCDAAFGTDYSDADADACAGGIRFLAIQNGDIVGHAALITRRIVVGGEVVQAGYVEGVAVMPAQQGKGIGLALMTHLTNVARTMYPLSMLSTGAQAFYAKLGWESFRGQSFVVENGVLLRTADEDEGLMVLTAAQRFTLPGVAFVCEWRPGDVW